MNKKFVIGVTPRIIVEDGVEKYFNADVEGT